MPHYLHLSFVMMVKFTLILIVALTWQWNLIGSLDNFFSQDKTAIICASHDAQYLPETGECISGPCPQGSMLTKLDVQEKDGEIFLCQAL
jgi:nitrite reductase/ring-hydroxylating ferredoxin subunit